MSGWSGIDLSKFPLDHKLSPEDSTEENRIRSLLDQFTTISPEVPKWTPRIIAEKAAIGGLSGVSVGSAVTVADEMERWVREGDIDGFNIAYVTTPGTFEEVVDLLVPELRRRGVYPEASEEQLTARERLYGKGQSALRDDHIGSTYKYDVYKEDS